MRQDRDSGLWIPDSVPEKPLRPNFPPRLDIHDNNKHPTRVDGLTRSRGVVNSTGWGNLELPETSA